MSKRASETWKQAAERLESERDEAGGWLALVSLQVERFLKENEPTEEEWKAATQAATTPGGGVTRKGVQATAVAAMSRERVEQMAVAWFRFRDYTLYKLGFSLDRQEREAMVRQLWDVIAARQGRVPRPHFLAVLDPNESHLPEGLKWRGGASLLRGCTSRFFTAGAVNTDSTEGYDWSATPLWSLASRLFPGKLMHEIEIDARSWTVESKGGPKGSRQMRRVVRVLVELCNDAEEGISGWLRRMWGIVADDSTVDDMLRVDWTPDDQAILDTMMAWAVEQWRHEARPRSGAKGVVRAVETRLEGYGMALPVTRRDSLVRAASVIRSKDT